MMNALSLKKSHTFQDLDFFPLRTAFTGAPISLLDLPYELQIRIYQYVIGEYDAHPRKFLKIRARTWQSSEAAKPRGQSFGHFKLIYKDKYRRYGILCTCKAITPIAIEARRKTYSGTLRLGMQPGDDLKLLLDICELKLPSSQSHILPETRKLSLLGHCSKEMVLEAARCMPTLDAIELRYEMTDKPDALIPFAHQIGMNVGDFLGGQQFNQQIGATFEKGKLDWYCDEKTSPRVAMIQIMLQTLVANGHERVQVFMKTTFHFKSNPRNYPLDLVKIDRVTSKGADTVLRYMQLPDASSDEYESLGKWLGRIRVT